MSTYVYVIGPDEGPYKIGFAANLRSRHSGLQSGNHTRLVCHFAAADECAPKRERELHERFAAQRLLGEWFNVPLSEIRSAFKSLGLEPIDLPIGVAQTIEPIPDDEVEELFRGRCTPERFSMFRKAMGLNRSQAAEALGLSRNMPAKYEAGAPIPLYIALACAALVRGVAPWPN